MVGRQPFDIMDESPVAGQPRRPMRAGWVVLAVALVAAGAWYARRSGGPGAAVAAGPGRPVMVMFTADWCGPCQALKASVLSHPAVLERLERKCRFRTVDLTEWSGPAAATAKHYGVDAIPTLIFVDADGDELSRYQGPRDPQSFARWIDQYAK
jgi:thiol-disulfide isomerase/thioredoxin